MSEQKRRCGIDPLRGLKTIILDFEKKQFSINGVDIGHCTNVEISFRNDMWTVSLEERANFTASGEYAPKKMPAASNAAGTEGS